jgi:hypothetical protein
VWAGRGGVMSKKFLAMRLQKQPQLEVDYGFGRPSYIDIPLPNGCEGIIYVFSNKQAAMAYYDVNVRCIEIEEGE